MSLVLWGPKSATGPSRKPSDLVAANPFNSGIYFFLRIFYSGEREFFLHRSHFRFLKCVLSDACPPTGLTNARFPKIAATRSVSNLRIHSPPEFLNPSPVRPAILSELLSSICFPQSP